MSNTINRRNLFNLIFSKLKINQDPKDPLFEKYSRKIFTGRRYQSVKSATKSGFTDRVVPVNSGLTPTAVVGVLKCALKRTGYF
jgi:hypothetical protein